MTLSRPGFRLSRAATSRGVRYATALVVACALGASTACENRLFVEGEDPEPVDMATGKLTQDGLYWVEYEPQPAPIPYNNYFLIVLYVADGADRVTPVPDASVDIVGFMPHDGNPHGMSTDPVVTAVGDGSYDVEGMLFHMQGLWNLDVY